MIKTSFYLPPKVKVAKLLSQQMICTSDTKDLINSEDFTEEGGDEIGTIL